MHAELNANRLFDIYMYAWSEPQLNGYSLCFIEWLILKLSTKFLVGETHAAQLKLKVIDYQAYSEDLRVQSPDRSINVLS